MSKKDPRRSDFVPDIHDGPILDPLPVYTSTTIPRNGGRTSTTVTRTDSTGDRLQVGVIEWPVRPNHRAQLVVGTRDVSMSRAGIYTSPERFTAADGFMYEWQIRDARPQLVPLQTYTPASAAYIATFVQSESGSWLRRKQTSSLFIPPEGIPILDDIIVTFIYFESKWRDKEGARSRVSMSSVV